MEEDRRFLQLSGLAGLVAGIFMILALAFFAAIPPSTDPEAFLVDFLADRTLLTAAIYLLALGVLLLLPLLIALYGRLKKTSPTFAAFGVGLGVLATIVILVSVAGIFSSALALSALYDSAAPGDEAIAVAAWSAVSGLLNGVIAAGLLFIGIGFASLGVAMLETPGFERIFGWVSVVLGLIAILLVFLPPSPISIIVAAAFALILGWKVYSLSRAA